jgi:hypothetical protein
MMNKRYKRVPTRFAPEIRFEVTPGRLRSEQDTELEQLKVRLLRERSQNVWETRRTFQLRRAADEAAALAWVTPYPLLVFPALFEEKALDALRRVERQDQVRLRSRELLVV